MKAILTIFLLLSALPAGAAEFHGYPCTKDCSGHKAGYEWAKKKGLTDPADCKGKSNSFVEGCRAFTTEFEDTPYAPPEEPANDKGETPKE